MKENRTNSSRALLRLSHELGRADRPLAILGEGNTSVRLSAGRFLIKASGANLATLASADVVECKADVLLKLLDKRRVTDSAIESALLASRVNPQSKKPSVEALFHAFCLSLSGVGCAGHAHPIAVNQILCSPRAAEFAVKRIFPDEIVCCGAASVFVPYTDPGFELAREIRRRSLAFIARHRSIPRVILMENHGILTLGRNPESVLAAMLMAEKAASIWLGAAVHGGPKFLSQKEVERIASRSDEHYRRRILNI